MKNNLKYQFIAAISAISLVGLSGCDSELRRAGGAGLEPSRSDGTMRWKTFADAAYPLDSAKAEGRRLKQLDRVLELNAACPAGYDVVDRQNTMKSQGLIGDMYDVFYTVRCR